MIMEILNFSSYSYVLLVSTGGSRVLDFQIIDMMSHDSWALLWRGKYAEDLLDGII